MKKLLAWILMLAIAAGCAGALAEADLNYEGTVVAGETIPVTVPFGGRIEGMAFRAGSRVAAGEVLATIASTPNYAPVEGTVRGLYAAEGDAVDTVTERYGAVLYIEPTHKYMLEASSEKAFNNSDNYFIHLGEKVYLSCVSDGSHTGTGFISAMKDEGFSIEVTGGEFYLNEKVNIFRNSEMNRESCIGRGTVKRSSPVAVKGSGSLLKLHAKDGDFVERGELLFETVEGVLDGFYAPDSKVLSPVNGVIVSADKNTGDSVSKGDALVRIAPADSFQVEFEVPESDLFNLTEGQKVTMELYWDNAVGETYSGVISEISHISEEQKASGDKKVFKAYVQFQADERIRLGMTMVLYPVTAENEGTEEQEE